MKAAMTTTTTANTSHPLARVAPRLLSLRTLPHASPALCAQFAVRDHGLSDACSLGFLSADQDDSLYAALDHATKMADVKVVYARSLYAGAAHSSGPLSGEVLGVLAARDPDVLAEGLKHAKRALEELFAFYTLPNGSPIFPTVIARTGAYLSKQADVPLGSSIAYLVGTPIESMIGFDAALKAASVKMTRFFGPPTETNFAAAYLSGSLDSVQAAANAFVQAIADVTASPIQAIE